MSNMMELNRSMSLYFPPNQSVKIIGCWKDNDIACDPSVATQFQRH